MLKKLKMFFLMPYILGQTGLLAQEAFTVTGGDLSGGGGTLGYSVGQPSCSTNEAGQVTVFEGVEVPFEAGMAVVVPKSENISLRYYPNPATSFVMLRMDPETDLMKHALYYELISPDGKVLATKKIVDTETTIRLEGYPANTYILKLVDAKETVGTFKINKN